MVTMAKGLTGGGRFGGRGATTAAAVAVLLLLLQLVLLMLRTCCACCVLVCRNGLLDDGMGSMAGGVVGAVMIGRPQPKLPALLLAAASAAAAAAAAPAVSAVLNGLLLLKLGDGSGEANPLMVAMLGDAFGACRLPCMLASVAG